MAASTSRDQRSQGSSINGILAALNRIIDITAAQEEGGTYVILATPPGRRGRMVEYRDMSTIGPDRFTAAKRKASAAFGGQAGPGLRGSAMVRWGSDHHAFVGGV
jgi:hypothetical protein